jgi:predicted AAA+ superfamily ATPase
MVSYFQGNIDPSPQEAGVRLEGYIHTRLLERLERISLSSQIYYNKPFAFKSSADALTFKPGEIDFIIQIGERIIPIEVKSTTKLAEIDTNLMCDYLTKYRRPFGIILYGGSPHIDLEKKIIYFPYWYV